MKKKLKKNKGIVFWITGLSGSGKTSLAKGISKTIGSIYGPYIEISGDDLRYLFKMKKYDGKSRYKYAQAYSKLCKRIADQNINVIFSTVSLMNKIRRWNKKNIKNYVEIYVKSNINKILKKGSKKILRKPRSLVGLHIKPEFPINSDITIINDFSQPINKLSKKLIAKIVNRVSY